MKWSPSGDARYQGVHKRPEAAGPAWHVATRPGLRRKLNPFIEPQFITEQLGKVKASVRAKVEHPFRVDFASRHAAPSATPPRIGSEVLQTVPSPCFTATANLGSSSEACYPTAVVLWLARPGN